MVEGFLVACTCRAGCMLPPARKTNCLALVMGTNYVTYLFYEPGVSTVFTKEFWIRLAKFVFGVHVYTFSCLLRTVAPPSALTETNELNHYRLLNGFILSFVMFWHWLSMKQPVREDEYKKITSFINLFLYLLLIINSHNKARKRKIL